MVDKYQTEKYREAGRACERVNDNLGARTNYQRAILEDPEDYNAIANLAWVEHKEGNTELAKGLIKKVCDAKPDKPRFKDLMFKINQGITRLD
ncbi:MAG: tetratricopeptide repeat protein [Candidatus Pacearchaeota archaeon]|jgi:tetratricopeptide (TPR) repeat protein